MILDGGRTLNGIESTVIDLTTQPPTLLRPGPILPALLEAVIGPLGCATSKTTGPLRSPGMMARHYAPRTPLTCVDSIEEASHIQQGFRIGLVLVDSTNIAIPLFAVETRILPANAPEYAALLYETLHDLDHLVLDRIVVVLPPATEEWLAVRDRLNRAATNETDVQTDFCNNL